MTRLATLALAVGALLIAGMATLTVLCIAPPDVRGVDAPATEFSAARARVHIDAIARTPHPVGSAAHEEVRAYLLRTLADLGLATRVQESRAALKAAAVTHAAHVKNVIARLPGTRAGPAVLLAAHYDSVAQSLGASDDGSGVATLLETARALVHSPRLENDVIFLFTDAEEVAGCGSFAFTEEELANTKVGVAMNFEARGTRGAVALYDTSDNNGALIRAVAGVVPRVVSTSLLATLARALPNDSDATLFKRAGIPTLAFAYVDHFYQYHQYTDSTDALDLRSVQHDGDYALPLARYLGHQALPLTATPSVAYFDLFGRVVVSYGSLVARALGLMTLALFAVLLARARREHVVTARGVAAAAAVAVAMLVLVGLASTGVHLALRAALGSFILSANPWLATTAGLVAGLAIVLVVVSRIVRETSWPRAVFGAWSVWAVALALTLVFAPVASFAFQWPLLFGLLPTGVWLRARGTPSARLDASITLALLPAAFFWGHIGYTLFVMLGPQAPEAVVVASAFPMMLTLPILARLTRRDLFRLGVIAAVAAALIAGVGVIVVRSSRGVRRPDSLVYALDVARHVAKWTTTDGTHDSFVAQRIPPHRKLTHADLYDLAPLVTEAHSADEGGFRHSTLHVRSPRGARCVRIWEITPEAVARARVDGKDVADVVRFSPETDEKLARFFMGGHSQSSWVMEHCGADASGFTVELFSAPGRQIKVRIIEYADGFPGPALRPRSDADGYPDPDSDVTTAGIDVAL